MKIGISGSSGFIGSHLRKHLEHSGYEVIPITRTDFSLADSHLEEKLQGVSVLVNLAGHPIIKRWTARNRDLIYNSRIQSTKKLVRIIRKKAIRPKLFINASAIGIYENGKRHSESKNSYSSSFPGALCRDWEAEATEASTLVRTVIPRISIVLGKNGGALSPMLPLFRMGLGGPLGSGSQPFPWIHIDDLIAAFVFFIEKETAKGIYNMSAPGLTDNRTFTKLLARQLHRPAFLPVPAFALKALYGKAAVMLLEGPEVIPEKLQKEGFRFSYPELNQALKNLL